ncbi:uncharacterized protein MKZ38_001446 [Zalerion maritima]|uniref:Tudor domain-containing protein n=1 Tax=Zalerion maritima TaxID=339359 RepID=A0AAD5RXI4_9PEZI|nr:uncharacterized protein MKZ38_001446 [Zalerion maritima]
MSADIAGLEEDRKEYQEQLDLVEIQLRDDPESPELGALRGELKSAISLIDDSINDLKPSAPALPPKKQPSPPTQPEKWSRENHPAFKKAAPPEEKEPEAPVVYQVNDEVQAKWVSGDKAFYPARITSITGSSSDPIYIVTFKGYGNTETLRSRDIRPLQKPQKRKADAPANAPIAQAPSTSAAALSPRAPAPPSQHQATTPSASNNGVVLSAAANLYPEKVLEAKRAAEQQEDGSAPKRKKIKAKKELEAGKTKWKEFNTKSKFGKHKKDSMFRTPEGIHGRVGFTGSGQAMRKDPTRSRHVYQTGEEMD